MMMMMIIIIIIIMGKCVLVWAMSGLFFASDNIPIVRTVAAYSVPHHVTMTKMAAAAAAAAGRM